MRHRCPEVPELPRTLADRLCAAGAEGDLGMFASDGAWWIRWRTSDGRQFEERTGDTREGAAALMASWLHKSGHSVAAFTCEIDGADRASEMCHGVYYCVNPTDGWRLAGQFRTADMADEQIAYLTIEAAGRDALRDVQVKRVTLPVEYGRAPKTIPRLTRANRISTE